MRGFKIRCRCNRRHSRRKEPPFFQVLLAALGALGSAVGGAAGATAGAVGSAAGAVGGALGSAAGAVGGALGSAAGSVGSALGGAAQAVAQVPGALGQAAQLAGQGIQTAAQGIGQGAQAIGQGAQSAAQGIGKGIGQVAKAAGKGADKAGSSMENMLKMAMGQGGGGGGGRGEGLLGRRPDAINSLARGYEAPARQAMLMPAKPAATPFVSPNQGFLNNMQQFAAGAPSRGGRWASLGDALSGASPITRAAAGPGSSAAGGPASQMPQNKGKEMMKQVQGLMGSMKPGGGKMQQRPYQPPPPMAPLQTPPVPQIAGGRAWVPPGQGQGNDGLPPWMWFLRRKVIT